MTATARSSPAGGLRDALAGVRGLLLDLDGVLTLRGAAIPGAPEAIGRLLQAQFPFVVVTNASLVSRTSLAGELHGAGMPIGRERILSAVSGSAAYARRHFDGKPLYVLSTPDAIGEFEGLRLLSHDEAAQPGARAAAVVVGDAGEDFTPRNMNTAFRLLRDGARFLAMHKNRWWYTADGPTLDAGGFVAGLEFATQRRALVMGKPSRAFFGEGLRQLQDVAGRPLARADVAMLGDDLWNDVLGAQGAGCRGVLVRSGKHGDAELARAAAERGGRAPTAVAPSIAEVVAALLDRQTDAVAVLAEGAGLTGDGGAGDPDAGEPDAGVDGAGGDGTAGSGGIVSP